MDVDCIYPLSPIQRPVKVFEWEKLFPKIVFTQSRDTHLCPGPDLMMVGRPGSFPRLYRFKKVWPNQMM